MEVILAAKSNKKMRVSLEAVHKVIPVVDGEEYQSLKESIRNNGQLVPVVVDKKGNIIDGRARTQICEELGIEVIKVELPEAVNTATCATDINLFRRHLTLGQRAFIGAELAVLAKGSNQHTAVAGGSRKQASEIMGVSEDSIDRANRIKTGGSEALREKVLKGEISLAKASELVKKVPDKEGQDRVLRKDIDFFARSFKREAVLNELREEAKGLMANNAKALSALEGKYNVVYADPPWDYGGNKKGSFCDPSVHYPLMKLKDIKALPVKSCLTRDASLFLWVPSCLLQEGLEVLNEWGFKFVGTMVWCKDNFVGAKGPTKTAHEILLIGKKGKSFHLDEGRMLSWHHEKRSEHSRKPEVFAEMLDAMYPRFKKLEMFARQPRGKGWSVFGNEVLDATAHVAVEQKPVAKVAANDADFQKAA